MFTDDTPSDRYAPDGEPVATAEQAAAVDFEPIATKTELVEAWERRLHDIKLGVGFACDLLPMTKAELIAFVNKSGLDGEETLHDLFEETKANLAAVAEVIEAASTRHFIAMCAAAFASERAP